MAVNFNMLKQAGPANFYEGLVQGQEQQRVNALEQQKMAQEQQKMAQEQEINALRMQQTRGAISQQERQVKAQNAAQKTAMFRERLLRAPNPNSVRDLVKMQYADPDLGPILSQTGTLEQALAEVPDDPVQFERHRQQEALGMSEWMKSQLPKTVGNAIYKPDTGTFVTPPERPAAPPASAAEYALAQRDPNFMRFLQERAAATRTPAQPSAPVAVIDPATNQAIYVSREEALRNKMQPASGATSLKPLTEGQAIKLRTDVGKDYKAATTALSQMDDLLDSIDKVKTAPGLSAATGFTGKYLPSFSEGKAAQAETRLANLRGKVTALGKATAAMSGAIGSIANQEWKILSDQIAALDEVKGKGPLLEQIDLVEQQALGAISRIRDTYEKTRSEDFERFPQFRDLPAPRGKKDSGGGTGGFKYIGKEGG
jgi:hypothetical protein